MVLGKLVQDLVLVHPLVERTAAMPAGWILLLLTLKAKTKYFCTARGRHHNAAVTTGESVSIFILTKKLQNI